MTEPRPMLPSVLLAVAVPDDMAIKVARLTDDKLARIWIVNVLPASITGPGSLFYNLQAAVCQEAKRRHLKLNGMME